MAILDQLARDRLSDKVAFKLRFSEKKEVAVQKEKNVGLGGEASVNSQGKGPKVEMTANRMR